MNSDYHTHSTYSDGDLMKRMIQAAESEGVTKLGIADHCNVSERPVMKQAKRKLGFNLDMTYKRRRQAINAFQEKTDVQLFDAVEMDFHPKDREQIQNFLEKAGFDYAVGSVHHLEDVNIHVQYFQEKDEEQQFQLVDQYFDYLVELIESELVDIAAHIDVIERNPAFRDKPDRKHYRKVAKAFRNSETIPEINAGRVLEGLEELHPVPDFMEILETEGIEFTVGTDAHTPSQLVKRHRKLEKELENRNLKIVEPF